MSNTYIKRRYDDLVQQIWPGKVTVIYGPRRAGKTTLVKRFLQDKNELIMVTGDDSAAAAVLASHDLTRLKDYIGTAKYVFIDEAQAIPKIGQSLKLLIDNFPERQFIVTGSSSFDLTYRLGEPLTGRQHQLVLYPVSLGELKNTFAPNEVQNSLPDYLVFGMYPEIRACSGRENKISLLQSLVESYLLRDVLQFGEVKNTLALRRLLTALAYQIGSTVSLNELANTVQIDVKTVGRYLDLLEQSFVIYPLGGYSRNLRSEMIQKRKYYFYDVGVRNTLIGDFNEPDVRGDIGGLFENFVAMERVKYRAYGQTFYANDYFWQGKNQKEIDLLEDYDGILHAFEIKWSPRVTVKISSEFAGSYPQHTFEVINRENFLQFC